MKNYIKKHRKGLVGAVLCAVVVGLLTLTGFKVVQLANVTATYDNTNTKYGMLKKSVDEMDTEDVTYQENLTYENMKTIAKTNNEVLTDSMKALFDDHPTEETQTAAKDKLVANHIDEEDAQKLVDSNKKYAKFDSVEIYNYNSDTSRKGHYYYSNVTVKYSGRNGKMHTNRYLFKVTLNHQDLNSNKIRFYLIQSFVGERK
ncbi:hypothetical protein R4B61_03050 [Fructilactobacillus vespulae]|uniref:hypothetical protein n=1 Tax=Fructilactobacillus vespulae TaxID=1249630 RepID=UPI0039B3CD44